MKGARTTADLAEMLGTTGENARQQLLKLAGDGLVEASTLSKGVGRPTQVWKLTDEGAARFPDTHAEFAVGLLETIRDTLGLAALDKLIAARESKTRSRYLQTISPADGLEDRLHKLAQLRADEGYMAEWQRADDGDGWFLHENHCPICAAASVCQGLCRNELSIFQEVLGDGCSVTRVSHILAGARRCSYRIVPLRPST